MPKNHRKYLARLRGQFVECVIATNCSIRLLPLLLSDRPGTPLRLLCVMAFDTWHTLRFGSCLPPDRARTLCSFLDFAACANAAVDYKSFRPADFERFQEQLEATGIREFIGDYLRRLYDIEQQRPSPCGVEHQFETVRRYREAVVRLSMGAVRSVACGHQNLDDLTCQTDDDEGPEILFRIVMLCQIIDDVADYSNDLSLHLPSFLTSHRSLTQAINLTQNAVREYSCPRPLTGSNPYFPFRLALAAVSAFTQVTLKAIRCRNHFSRWVPWSQPISAPLIATQQLSGECGPRCPNKLSPRIISTD